VPQWAAHPTLPPVADPAASPAVLAAGGAAGAAGAAAGLGWDGAGSRAGRFDEADARATRAKARADWRAEEDFAGARPSRPLPRLALVHSMENTAVDAPVMPWAEAGRARQHPSPSPHPTPHTRPTSCPSPALGSAGPPPGFLSLPLVPLGAADDQHLFELNVRLQYSDDERLQLPALTELGGAAAADFPAEALLQRRSLLVRGGRDGSAGRGARLRAGCGAPGPQTTTPSC
jgi:hypothetical protein